MTTMTHPQGFRFSSPQALRPVTLSARDTGSIAARTERWLDQLAAWSERQPSHHRPGRWVSLR